MADPVPGAEKAAGGVGGFLTKKVGPLPVWAYAAAAGAGLLALKFVHGGSSSGGGGGVTLASPVPVASGGAPAGSGGDFAPPAPTGPRQAPPPQDQPITGFNPGGFGPGQHHGVGVSAPTIPGAPALTPPAFDPGGFGPGQHHGAGVFAPPSTLIPGAPTLTPTAPVQPPASGTPTWAPPGSTGGGVFPMGYKPPAPPGGGSYSGGPVAGLMTSPGGPTVPFAPVSPPGIDNSPANVAARNANINPIVNRWTPESLDPNHPLATAATQGTMGTDKGASAR